MWVDGFHTGYVLDSLMTCVEMGIGGDAATRAWHRGLGYYARSLIEVDGTPRYGPESRYPIDGQCAAQALQTLSLAVRYEPTVAVIRWDVLSYVLDRLARGDGAFIFQRQRWLTCKTPHARWVQAPLLRALTCLLESVKRGNELSNDRAEPVELSARVAARPPAALVHGS